MIIGFLIVTGSTQDYSSIVDRMVRYVRQPGSPMHHSAYERLAYISDTWGPRMWGSSVLQQVIKEMERQARVQGFDNVRLQPVTNFTRWQRGHQQLTLYDPRPIPQKLKVIGLGNTVSGDIQGNVVVISNYSQLQLMKDKVKGNIVLFNNQWVNYGSSVQYRVNGASAAAKYGATAMLIRSVTPFSIESVHTGIMFYNQSVKKIPGAAISLQDAEMMARMQKRGQTIKVHLILQNKQVANTNSNNLVFQIKGSKYPEQILLLGGHIDSWDTGSQTGANDDGGGFVTCFQALRVIKKLGLKPKRTLRFIAWSGQQWGDPRNGAHQYVQKHKDQIKNHVVAFQSDLGSTKIQGFGFSGNNSALFQKVKTIAANYLVNTGAITITDQGHAADTTPLFNLGVPTMVNLIKDTPDHRFYFSYHHTAGDSMTMMDPQDMDSNVVGIASMFYILADQESNLLRQ